jgi:hypothetical protein
MELLAELKKRQGAPLVREGKDGAIEDIITGRRRWRAALLGEVGEGRTGEERGGEGRRG